MKKLPRKIKKALKNVNILIYPLMPSVVGNQVELTFKPQTYSIKRGRRTRYSNTAINLLKKEELFMMNERRRLLEEEYSNMFSMSSQEMTQMAKAYFNGVG